MRTDPRTAAVAPPPASAQEERNATAQWAESKSPDGQSACRPGSFLDDGFVFACRLLFFSSSSFGRMLRERVQSFCTETVKPKHYSHWLNQPADVNTWPRPFLFPPNPWLPSATLTAAPRPVLRQLAAARRAVFQVEKHRCFFFVFFLCRSEAEEVWIIFTWEPCYGTNTPV